MKRLVSVFVSLCVLLCCCNASASVSLLYDVLTTPYYSGSTESNIYVKLNRPLTFLNKVMETEVKRIEVVDVKKLAESAFDFDCSFKSVEYVDSSYMKFSSGIEGKLDLPLEINSNLKTDIYSDVGFWFNADFTDVNKPIFDFVAKVPYSDDYIICSFADFIKSGADFQPVVDGLKRYSEKSIKNELSKYLLELVKKHCAVKEVRTSMEYTIFADDAAFKAVVVGLMTKIIEMSKDAYGDYGNYLFDEQFYDVYEDLCESFTKIPVIGKEGVTVTVRTKGKRLLSVDCNTHICVNVYDLMKSYGEDVQEFDREDWFIDFSMISETTYTKYNEPVEVVFPEVSAENTITLSEAIAPYYSDESEVSVYTSYPIDLEQGGMFMMPLRDCFASIGLDKDEYYINGDVIDVVPKHEDSPCAKASLEIGSNKMLVNGSEKTLARRVQKNDDGLILVSADTPGYIINAQMVGADINLKDMFGVSEITYEKNEAATAPDMDALIDYDIYEDEYAFDDDDKSYEQYVSPMVWLEHDGAPLVRDNVLYLPLVLFLSEFDVTDISYNAGVVMVNAPDEHPKEFSRIQLKIDSNVVVIDDVEYTMANAVVGKDGCTYVPGEFFELMDCELLNVDRSFKYNTTSYDMFRNQYENSYSHYYISEYKWLDIESAAGIVKDDSGYYLPLNNIVGPLYIREENIVSDGDIITITAHDSVSGFEKIVISGTGVDMDGTIYTIDAEPKKIKDSIYIHQSFVEQVFGGEIQEVWLNYDDEGMTAEFSLWIKNPQYKQK